MVVGAPYVDRALEPPLELVRGVGDVRCEVGRFTVLAHQDAVLLVAEGGRAEPQRALVLVDVAAFPEALHRPPDVARVHQRAFGEPFVEGDAELLEVAPDVGDLRLPGEREDPAVALGAEQGAGARDQRIHVGFLVSALRLVGGDAVHEGFGVDGEAGRVADVHEGFDVDGTVPVARMALALVATGRVELRAVHQALALVATGRVELRAVHQALALVATGRVELRAVHQALALVATQCFDLRVERRRDPAHVPAPIAVRGKRDRLPAALQVPQPYAQREDVHLAARVVDVVLALHVVPGRFEEVRDAGAVRGAPSVPDVQRAGGVRGHELHLDAAAFAERRAREPRAFAEDAAHHRGERLRRDAEVDEAGIGDRDRGDRGRFRQPRHDALGDLARLGASDARQGEGDGAREIPVAVPAAALDRDLGQGIEGEAAFVAKRRQRAREKRSDVLLHGPDTPRFARMGTSRIGRSRHAGPKIGTRTRRRCGEKARILTRLARRFSKRIGPAMLYGARRRATVRRSPGDRGERTGHGGGSTLERDAGEAAGPGGLPCATLRLTVRTRPSSVLEDEPGRKAGIDGPGRSGRAATGGGESRIQPRPVPRRASVLEKETWRKRTRGPEESTRSWTGPGTRGTWQSSGRSTGTGGCWRSRRGT